MKKEDASKEEHISLCADANLESQGLVSQGELRMLQEKYNRQYLEHEQAKLMLARMQEDKKSPDEWNIEDTPLSLPIVGRFHKMASSAAVVPHDDWNELRQASRELMPNFIDALARFDYQLNRKETSLCILIRLRFIPSELSVLLGMKINNLSNLRKRLLKKVFGIDGSSQEFDERINSSLSTDSRRHTDQCGEYHFE